MKPDSLAELLEHYDQKPFGPVPGIDDWAAIETRIGRVIPSDYKAIVQHTGGSSLGRCWIRNPAVKDNIHIALSHEALLRLQILEGEIAQEKLNIELYPEPGGWIQLAHKDRVSFMLRPVGDDVVIVCFSGWEVIETGKSFSDLMWAMFNDRKLYGELGESIWHDSDRLFGF